MRSELYLEAQNYVTASSGCVKLIHECINQILMLKPLYQAIWVNNLLNAKEIIEPQIELMEFCQKWLVVSKHPEIYLNTIRIHAINVASIIPIVAENYEKAIKNADPFFGNKEAAEDIIVFIGSHYLH